MRQLWASTLLLLILGWGLAGCEDYGKNRTIQSGGSLDELMIILADSQHQGPLADTLIRYLNSPYPGLPQYYEPLFPIMIRKFSRYQSASDVFHKYRNLVFATSFKEEDEINLFVQKHIGEAAFKAAYAADSNWFTVKDDEFAEPQMSIYLYAPTYAHLFDRFVRYREDLYQEIRESETDRLRSQLYATGRNKKAEEAIQSRFGFTVKVPEEYLVAKNDSNLVHLKSDMRFRDKKENTVKEIKRNLLFTSFEVNPEDRANMTYPQLQQYQSVGYPVVLQDSLTSHALHGKDSTYVVYTDVTNSLIFQDTLQLAGREILRSRGLWALDRPFMGGPFLTYTYTDGNRVNMLYAMIYAAGSDKRKLVREVEAIFSTLSFALDS